MRFANPHYFFLLALIPLGLGLFLWSWRQRRQAWKQLIDPELSSRLLTSYAPHRALWKNLLKAFCFIFLTFALINPQWGFREEQVSLRGTNLMVLVDVSQSMLAQDVQPSRLQRMRLKVRQLLEMAQGDRIGIVAFAGRSFILSPLTVDTATLARYMDEISTETIPVPGTDIAGALQLALKSFAEQNNESQAILLMTDGEDHSERMKELLEKLQEEKIPVYVLGIGTPEGAPIPDPEGGFKTDQEGRQIVSKLQEDFLKSLALKTAGAYARTVSDDADLRELYLKGIRKGENLKEFKVSKKRIWENRFYFPLAVALFFLALERLIPEAKKIKAS